MPDRQPVPRATPDLIEEQIERLREIFPEAFSEGSVDFDRLRETLGEIVDDSPERYSLTWAGKREALRQLQRPSWGTLVPDREQSVNFDDSDNVFIEGENLEVLKLLRKSYSGRVKMIYIDPPYNTGNDFVYPDNFAEPRDAYLRVTGQRDDEGNLLTTNPETSGRYHSAWLCMMYPRLFLARQLLREDGVIFISIDDHEVHNLRLLMNEVFGEENFICQLIWKKRSTPPNDQIVGAQHEYVVIYGRDTHDLALHLRSRTPEQMARYTNPDDHPKGPWTPGDLMANVKGGRYVASLYFPIVNPNTGEEHFPSSDGNWRFSQDTIAQLLENNEIHFGENGKGRPKLKRFLSGVKDGVTWTTIWDFVPLNTAGSQEMEAIFGNLRIFENPKPSGLIANLLQLGLGSTDIVLDFFAGSCTTAHAVMDLNREDGGNRRFVMVQLPEPTPDDSAAREAGFETIADIGSERIRRVIERLEEDDNGRLDVEDRNGEDLGFRVFKLAETNLRPWREVDLTQEGAEAAVVEQLQRQMDPLREGWSEEAVIAEVALKEGFGLNCRVEPVEDLTSNTVYRVTDPDLEQAFYICLDDEIEEATWLSLDLSDEELFVCRDVALDDTKLANLALQCRLHTI